MPHQLKLKEYYIAKALYVDRAAMAFRSLPLAEAAPYLEGGPAKARVDGGVLLTQLEQSEAPVYEVVTQLSPHLMDEMLMSMR